MSVEIGPLHQGVPASIGGVARTPRQPDRPEAPRDAQDAREDAPHPEGPLAAVLDRLTAGPKFDARLSIIRDDVTRDFVYRFLDMQTGEIVRQFPQEEMLELLRYLSEQQGLLVDQRV